VQNVTISILRFVFFVSTLVFLVLPGQAKAIEYGGFGGRPANPRSDNPRTESIFIYTLEPGEEKLDAVTVINNTPERKTLLVYAADSTPSTGGAFACKQFSEDKQSVGAWITVSKSEVTLDSGTNETVPFTIRVPQSAGVGEHNGCILIQEKKVKNENQSGVSLSVRTGLRVAITIPGDIVRKLELAGFTLSDKPEGYLLHPQVRNIGNVSIDADVQVVTKSVLGFTVMEHGGEFPILKGEVSDWNFELPKPFWGGWYRSSFAVEYDENPEASVGIQSGKNLTLLKGDTIWFFSFPTIKGLILELLILVLAAYLYRNYRKFKKHKYAVKNDWIDYRVKSGDTINSLADQFNISWKSLARANKVKAPYALEVGIVIKVPPAE